MPTSMEELLRQSSCALCGSPVYLDSDGEGRVHCQGCKMATDNCTCKPGS